MSADVGRDARMPSLERLHRIVCTIDAARAALHEAHCTGCVERDQLLAYLRAIAERGLLA